VALKLGSLMIVGWFYHNQSQKHIRQWTMTYTLIITHKTHMKIKTYKIGITSQDVNKELMNLRKTNIKTQYVV
jgi:hypothetical protein